MKANREEFTIAFTAITLAVQEFTNQFAHCENQDEMNEWAEELTMKIYGGDGHESDNAEGSNASNKGFDNGLAEA